jgi:hypothetical protein
MISGQDEPKHRAPRTVRPVFAAQLATVGASESPGNREPEP